MYRRILSLSIIICFILTSFVPVPWSWADVVSDLPQPGKMIFLSSAYTPVLIKGVKIHPDNPLLFDFILDSGHSGLSVTGDAFKSETQKLIKYFLVSLTIKEDDLWVNLSPYEKDRIVPKELGATQLGQDMLTQDYILKQLTASMIYPEKDFGRKFWDRVYAQAQKRFGRVNIPVNTFNKVWIVPDKAKVLQRNNTAFVIGAHLKVMLEEDYLSVKRHNAIKINSVRDSSAKPQNDVNLLGSQVVRQIVLPELEREVNDGRHFAPLRQMFYSMILSSWYKRAMKEALLNQVYANKAKIGGVQSTDPAAKEKIYQHYLQAYKKGVFNYIREDFDRSTNQIVSRKYFSGGTNFAMLSREEIVSREPTLEEKAALRADGVMAVARTQVEKSSARSRGALVTLKGRLRTLVPGIVSSLAALVVSGHAVNAAAQNSFTNLYPTSLPYIQLFQTNALTTVYPGFTRSFQGATVNTDAIGMYGASSYDLTILGRLRLYNNNNTAILDTFMTNFGLKNNALFNYNNGYTDASGNPINNLVFNMQRIGGFTSGWWNTWDFNVDIGAQAELINYVLDAYHKTGNANYLNFATALGDALLQLQDTDGGFRFGPIGIYNSSGNNVFWNMKSTEKVIRVFYAIQNLYSETYSTKYYKAGLKAQGWLENMYDKTNHLFSPSATLNGSIWGASPLGVTNAYVPTDVTAMAAMSPNFMYIDPYFGATQALRDTEIRAMFNAIEKLNANTNASGLSISFRFTGIGTTTVQQTGNYVGTEWSSQMAEAYFTAAKFYYGVNQTNYIYYINRYNTLMSSVGTKFFSTNSTSPLTMIAPYASYTNGTIAGGVATGTGYYTEYYPAALASAWYSFAKVGFNPEIINGGAGIPYQPVITSIIAVPHSTNVTLTIVNPVGVTSDDIYSANSLTGPWTLYANIAVTNTTTLFTDTRARATQRYYKAAIHNPAMTTPTVLKASTNWVQGGIDLNSRNMQIDTEGQKIDIKFNPAIIAQFRTGDFSGVYPVIISIKPVSSASFLLGLNT